MNKTAVKHESTPVLLAPASILQRKCACGQHTIAGGECDECGQKQLSLQRAARNPELERRDSRLEIAKSGGVPAIVHEVINSSGQPLDATTRLFFEPRFEHDFSHVRVHTDTKAAASARAVNAQAYTVGRDVVFGAGQYQSATSAGRQLLGHELTHVVQQGGGHPVGRSTYKSATHIAATSLNMRHPHDAAEIEAERVGNLVATGSRLALNVSTFEHKLNRKDETPPPTRTPLDKCRTEHLSAQVCATHDERNDREEAVRLFLMNKGYEHIDIVDMAFEKMSTFEQGEIRECDNGPGESWHCSVNIKNKEPVIVSIFACLCCNKDDGTTSFNWNGPHLSGRHEHDKKDKPKQSKKKSD